MTDEVRLVAMRRHRAPNGDPYYMPVRVEPTPGQEHAWDDAWQDAITEEETEHLATAAMADETFQDPRTLLKLRAAFNPEGEDPHVFTEARMHNPEGER